MRVPAEEKDERRGSEQKSVQGTVESSGALLSSV